MNDEAELMKRALSQLNEKEADLKSQLKQLAATRKKLADAIFAATGERIENAAEQKPVRPQKGIVGGIEAVLKERGEPMHIDDILKGLEERGITGVQKQTAVGVAVKYLNKKFRRAAPNTFELINK